MKVILLGKGEMLANLIEGCIDAKAEIVGIFRYEYTKYPKLKLFFKDFFKSSNELTLIKKYKLHEIKCKSANSEEFKKEVIKLNADVILIGTWGEKLSKDIINLPVLASVNVHPSFLPKYRGPNPYLQTILNGEKSSGITFHLIDENFDTGSILMQKKIDILPDDTSKELKERTVFQARLMCAELLKKLEYGMIIPVSQDEQKSSYFPNIKREDIMLDFRNENSEKICARIKAFYPWLPTYVTHENKFFIPNPYKLSIINSETFNNTGEIIQADYKNFSITVQCKDNKAIKMGNIKIYGIWNKIFLNHILKKIYDKI